MSPTNGFFKLGHQDCDDLFNQIRPKFITGVVATWTLLYHRARWQAGYQQGIYLEPGQSLFSLSELSTRLGLSQRNLRTILNILRNLQKVTIKTTNQGSIATLINFTTYNFQELENDKQSDNTTTSERQANPESPPVPPLYCTSVKEEKINTLVATEVATNGSLGKNSKKKTKTKAPYVPSPEAVKTALAWHKYRPLPTTKPLTYYQEIFDHLHQHDGEPWEEIYAVCHYAVTAWGPEHILSPAKLLLQAKPSPDMNYYQFIQGKMKAAQANPEALASNVTADGTLTDWDFTTPQPQGAQP